MASLRIPVGMSDVIILFGNTESDSFKSAVRREARRTPSAVARDIFGRVVR